MKKRVLSVIALLLSLAMFVVGCSSGSKSEESAEKAESAGDKSGAITVAYQILTVINPQTGQLLL